jgi:hypothetical protein
MSIALTIPWRAFAHVLFSAQTGAMERSNPTVRAHPALTLVVLFVGTFMRRWTNAAN